MRESCKTAPGWMEYESEGEKEDRLRLSAINKVEDNQKIQRQKYVQSQNKLKRNTTLLEDGSLRITLDMLLK